MNKAEDLDLDEHAAFWARNDERDGVADERFEFEIAGAKFAGRSRSARFAGTESDLNNRRSYFYEIDQGRALLVTKYPLFPLPANVTAENFLSPRRLFRPFHPREAARYGAAIYSDGTGEWFYRTQAKNGDLGFLSQSPFRLMKEPILTDFLKLPPTELLNLCLQNWNSPDSEMRQAYEFDQLTLAERDAEVLSCANSEAAELRQLMDLLAHLIWSEADRLEFRFEDDEENIVWLDLRSDELFEFGEHESAKTLDRIYKAWRAAIFRVLQPRYIGHKLPLHIRYWLAQERYALQFAVENPTFHEQLEAQLQLRAWAATHLSADEQSELTLLKR